MFFESAQEVLKYEMILSKITIIMAFFDIDSHFPHSEGTKIMCSHRNDWF